MAEVSGDASRARELELGQGNRQVGRLPHSGNAKGPVLTDWALLQWRGIVDEFRTRRVLCSSA